MLKDSWKLSIPFFLLILISACSPHLGSTLIGNQCETPCWQGIVPGVSNYDESMEFLNRINGLRITQTWSDENQFGIDQIIFVLRNQREMGGSIRFLNGKVQSIDLLADHWEASEVITLFGKPDSYISKEVIIESPHRYINLFYTKGIVVSIYPDSYNEVSSNSIVSEKSEVGGITFVQAYSDYSTLGDITAGLFASDFHPWTGYGELETITSN